MYEIYALLDPRDTNIRYIGYTSNPKTRLRDHMQSSRTSREKISHKSNWIRALDKEGLKPIYKTLARTKSLEEIKQLEIDHIAYYKQLYKLTNGTKGGDGVNGLKWSEESKARIKGKVVPGSGIKFQVEAMHTITGDYKIFKDKSEAASYIKCSESSIVGVSCGQRNSVNKWYVKLIKKGAQ